MSFVSSYLEYNQKKESPTSFWLWSAYSAISAVLRDNCYRRQGDSFLFPSTYIFLLGNSGTRKGPPVELCQKLVHAVGNTKIISGRASIQAILDELSRTETDRKTGRVTKSGSAIFFAPELAAGLVQDPQALSILTDIHDARTEANPFTSRLRTQVHFKIEKLVFSLFVASNEALARDLYTQQAKEGGLLARTLLITPDEFRSPNSLMRHEDRSKEYELLKESLIKISELNGEFIYEESAIQEYESWYVPFRNSLRDKNEKTGVLSRIHTNVLKVAMLLAANELTLNVAKSHIEEAVYQCVKLLPNYNMFTMTSGKGNLQTAGAIVLEALKGAHNHTLTQSHLLATNWAEFDIELLDKVAATFEIGGLLVRVVAGSVVSYTLTNKCLEILGGPKPKSESKGAEI